MKLQVVSDFNLVNNEATCCFRAQMSQMKLQVDSDFKQPKMKLQDFFNFKRLWNEATSCFKLQPSQ